MMTLILFAHQDSAHKGTIFKKRMEQNFKGVGIEVFQTFNGFKERLKQIYTYDKEVIVLLADSSHRLAELTSMMDLLDGKRIVLILPDDSEAAISAAHRFFPRYFTYVNDTYDDLCAVIIKMITQKKINVFI